MRSVTKDETKDICVKAVNIANNLIELCVKECEPDNKSTLLGEVVSLQILSMSYAWSIMVNMHFDLIPNKDKNLNEFVIHSKEAIDICLQQLKQSRGVPKQ